MANTEILAALTKLLAQVDPGSVVYTPLLDAVLAVSVVTELYSVPDLAIQVALIRAEG